MKRSGSAEPYRHHGAEIPSTEELAARLRQQAPEGVADVTIQAIAQHKRRAAERTEEGASAPPRRAFLDALERLEGEAGTLAALRDSVLPVARSELARWLARERARTIGNGLLIPDPDKLAADGTPLRDALLEWGTPRHLTDTWLLSAALGTVLDWCADEGEPARLRVCGFEWALSWNPSALTPEERRISFEHPGWAPDLPEWHSGGDVEEAKRRIRDAFERRLEQRLTEIQQHAAERRVRKAPPRRRRRSDDPDVRYDWLVCWQVLRLSQEEIADRYDVGNAKIDGHTGRGTIARSLEEYAQLIGLSLRPPATNQFG